MDVDYQYTPHCYYYSNQTRLFHVPGNSHSGLAQCPLMSRELTRRIFDAHPTVQHAVIVDPLLVGAVAAGAVAVIYTVSIVNTASALCQIQNYATAVHRLRNK